jgi:hypothetical protein
MSDENDPWLCSLPGCDNPTKWVTRRHCCDSHAHAMRVWAAEAIEAQLEGETPPPKPHADELDARRARAKRWNPERMQGRIDDLRQQLTADAASTALDHGWSP